jgi:hypothetical protein
MVSPLGWEHINLTGDYTWQTNKRVAKVGFRPLPVPRKAFGGRKFSFLEVSP